MGNDGCSVNLLRRGQVAGCWWRRISLTIFTSGASFHCTDKRHCSSCDMTLTKDPGQGMAPGSWSLSLGLVTERMSDHPSTPRPQHRLMGNTAAAPLA